MNFQKFSDCRFGMALIAFGLIGCTGSGTVTEVDPPEVDTSIVGTVNVELVEQVDPVDPAELVKLTEVSTKHGDLLCMQPVMENLEMDLVCNEIPNTADKSKALVMAGAFTGKLWNAGHGNIAGDHVSGGKRYSGYRCTRNTGAFTWSAKSGPKFHYKDYTKELNRAASEGGMGFAQEMLIHGGKQVETTRALDNRNQFRALCLNKNGKLAVYESKRIVPFGEFIKSLLDAGVTEALYTDMGTPWNYCFYRLRVKGPAQTLHKVGSVQYSNFIVFRVPTTKNPKK